MTAPPLYDGQVVIRASKEAYQGGYDFVLCNLIGLSTDLKCRGFDKATIAELDKFIERLK